MPVLCFFCYVKAYSQINLLQQRQDSAQVIIEDSVKAIRPSDTSTLNVPQQTVVTASIITKDSAVHVKEDTIKFRDSFLIDGSTSDSFFSHLHTGLSQHREKQLSSRHCSPPD